MVLYNPVDQAGRHHHVPQCPEFDDQYVGFELGFSYDGLYVGAGREQANINDTGYITAGFIHNLDYNLDLGMDVSMALYDESYGVDSTGYRFSPFMLIGERVLVGAAYEWIDIDDNNYSGSSFNLYFGMRFGI